MIEIMAPVGCYESLAAAIQAGAGSVYFGIQGLNMRSGSANNFTISDLKKIADICKAGQMPENYQSPQEVLYPETARGTAHCKPLKSYLTVNTIMYDGDLDKMRQIIDAASEAGITAIIASDVAAMTYARGWDRPDRKPRIEVHLSTQLNISNIEALKFYAQFADVVVLARELNMDQVAAIHQEIVRQDIRGPKGELIRIEMFAHGALCMAVSGKCYMSLHEYNRSANRGACAQVCRHAYDAYVDDPKYLLDDQDHDLQLQIDNKYIMSPKDLKTIHFMNRMIDAGVEVFKIEGRARGPEYVKTVVGCYSEAARLIGQTPVENNVHVLPDNWDELVAGWDNRLSQVFNRGFWNGYYLGQRLGEWSHHYGSVAQEHKEYAAKTVGWFSKIGIGDFLCEAKELHKGDNILIIGPTTGVIEIRLDEIQVDYKVVETVHKGERFTIPVSEKIRPSDKVYLLVKNG
jgi:putative protease